MSTTTVILRSPTEADLHAAVAAPPTINGERSVANQEEFLADSTVWIDATDLMEKHDCMALCLRGYNDFLFNLTCLPEGPGDRWMLLHKKEVLKREGLGYSALSLPDSSIPAKSFGCTSRTFASGCYGCSLPASDNFARHPDRATVVCRLGDLDPVDLGMLQKFLLSDPQRLMTKDDPPDVDLHLFAPVGTYKSMEVKVEKLRMKKVHKDADKQQLEFVKSLQVL
ncbi:hypothetical protein B0H13DRAFT_2316107 [Mycena leptocephala]|nr:hypothetical protein B0H13DRAFT_2316107 [Mycena leptocephala]